MKGIRKLSQYEDGEACNSTLQYGHLFGRNGDQGDFYREGFKLKI